MQINLSGHHVEITPALKDYVQSKIEKLGRHFDNITNVQVTLTVEKNMHKAEGTMHVAGANLHGESVSENMYAAIDELSDKLDRQILKHKEKQVDRRHGAGN